MDPYCEQLDAHAGEFHAALRDVIAELDGVLDPNGRTALLPDSTIVCFDNLANLAGNDPRQYRAIIRGFIEDLGEAPAINSMPWEEARPLLRTKLSGHTCVDDDVCVRLAPGLAQVLAIDLPDAVITLTNNRILDSWGVTFQEALAIGVANTIAELQHSHVDVMEISDSVYGMASKSFYASALLLVLEEMLPTVMDRELDIRRGMLVAVPTRHVVAFGFPGGEGSFLQDIRSIMDISETIGTNGSGPISTSAYFIDEHGLSRVAMRDSNGEMVWTLPDYLQRRLDEGIL